MSNITPYPQKWGFGVYRKIVYNLHVGKPKIHWTKKDGAELILARISEKLRGRKPNSGCFQKGHKNPWEGKKLPWAKQAELGRKKSGMYENKKPHSGDFKKGTIPWNWKGGAVGNVALHSWVKRQLGRPMVCEHCGYVATSVFKIHWANKSHEYKRSIDDWIRLCVSCHKKYDLYFIKNKK